MPTNPMMGMTYPTDWIIANSDWKIWAVLADLGVLHSASTNS